MSEQRNASLEQYLELARQRPELFANPPGAGTVILLDPRDIAQVEQVVMERLGAQGLPREWAKVGITLRDQYVFLLRDAVRFPDGSVGTYFRSIGEANSAPGVVMLPIYRGKVLLLRHFRHATRTWHWEIPRGYGESGVASENHARQELSEEIGATGVQLTSLGISYPDSGAGTDYVALFHAEVEAYGKGAAEEGIVEIAEVANHEFALKIANGEITDGYTLAAYARAKARGLV